MYPNRFRIIFCVFFVVMLLPVQASVRAAASQTDGSYAAPVRAMLDVDTETPTPTETETSTPTNTETPTPTLTETQADTDTPTATATPTKTVTPSATKTRTPTKTSTPTATVGPSTRYVASGGMDTSDCSLSTNPCATINYAIGQAAEAGNTIYVTLGTYTGTGVEAVKINKSVTLSGGWNTDFTMQTGLSIIDGQGARRGITSSGTTVVLDHFLIQHGSSDYGAGIRTSSYSSLTINNSMISNNTGVDYGGGIYNHGTLTINSSTLNGNTVPPTFFGSAIYNRSSGIVRLNNSTVSNNIAGDFSIYNAGDLTVNNGTISSNKGGIYREYGNVLLRNTIIAANTMSGAVQDCKGEIVSGGYNLFGTYLGCAIYITDYDIIGSPASPIDPQLESLQNNGGLTLTQALLVSSPAIQAGNPAAFGSVTGACLPLDQRGVARSDYGRCDIGAYESDIPLVETIKRVDSNPTEKSVVDFLVTFSKPVTGINNIAPFSDFSLTTTNLTGVSIVSVTGSGKQYQVTVKTGQGNGTIRLDFLDHDNVKDADDNPVGGTGTGNGDYTSGEVFDVQNARVSSINLANSSPTNLSSVRFILTFAENVTGVTRRAPFNDFSLTTTGAVKGAFITSVTGSGKIYAITVNRGSGDGTIQLNVIDDDTIKDDSGNPLGGQGLGNGNYTRGPAYLVRTIPTSTIPINIISGPTPTYRWSLVPRASHYHYQVFNGNQLQYGYIIQAKDCLYSCSYLPTKSLAGGQYRWRVRAMVGGVWMKYSPYQTFEVVIPQAGFWGGESDFYVTPNSKFVTHYKYYIDVPACNIYGRSLVITELVPIKNLSYSYSNDGMGVYFDGSFTSSTQENGNFSLKGYYLPGCGPIYGAYTKPHDWRNSNQPPSSTNTGTFVLGPVNPDLQHPHSIFRVR